MLSSFPKGSPEQPSVFLCVTLLSFVRRNVHPPLPMSKTSCSPPIRGAGPNQNRNQELSEYPTCPIPIQLYLKRLSQRFSSFRRDRKARVGPITTERDGDLPLFLTVHRPPSTRPPLHRYTVIKRANDFCLLPPTVPFKDGPPPRQSHISRSVSKNRTSPPVRLRGVALHDRPSIHPAQSPVSEHTHSLSQPPPHNKPRFPQPIPKLTSCRRTKN
jgi:hypothetical protein